MADEGRAVYQPPARHQYVSRGSSARPVSAPAFALGGPGPANYNVPSLFGRAPAASLKGRNDYQPDTRGQNPGPAAYTPRERPRTAVTIKGRVGSSRVDATIPGPGAYRPNDQHRAPAFSLSGRTRARDVDTTIPGPGEYAPERYRPTSPTARLAGRNYSTKIDTSIPGPGQYNISRENDAKSFSIRGRTRLPHETSDTPGPAAYIPERYRPQSPSASIRSRIPQKSMGHDSPGPKYDTRPASAVHKAPSLKGRTEIPGERSASPSPAHYRPESYRPSSPSPSIRSRIPIRDMGHDSPGPKYDTRPPSPSHRGPSLKGRTEIPGARAASPGPADYGQLDSPRKGGFTIAPRLKLHEGQSDSPGPAHYGRVDVPRPRSGIIITGRPPHRPLTDGPGPGHYHINERRAGGFTLGAPYSSLSPFAYSF
eukprot:Opistho-1_new@58101